MKLTKDTTKLVCELERIIGDECYNPNSYDGWACVEGCSFRYPVCYENKSGDDAKTRWTITDLDKTKINTVRYKFGSNHLFVGIAVVKVLEHLEEKYGLDFNELTKKK